MIDLGVLHWQVRSGGGWEHLLPRAKRRRWLCLDATRGATALLLAPLCEELHVVPANREATAEIAEKLRAEGATNVRLVVDEGYPEPRAGGNEGFDGFILHDLRGALGRRDVEEALRAGGRLVSPQGFIYAALRNRYGYTRLRRMWSDIGRHRAGAYFSACGVRRLMGRGHHAVLYPLISNGDGQVTDLIPRGGYVSAKNPSLVNELLRRWLLGRRGAARWSPGFAVVASGDPKARSGIAYALDTLGRRGVLKVPADPEALVKRYHVVDGGKVILSVGEKPERYGSHIVVLVRFPTYAARRRRESELLSRLAALPAEIADRIPRFFYEEEAGAARVFVQQEFPGVTLDMPGAGLRVATREATDFLLRLHVATRQPKSLTAVSVQEMFGGAFETARSRYPALVAELKRLEGALSGSLAGADLPVVWTHGDFKIENIVTDECSHRLLGVIDWEHSEPEGLPLLDLWYLLLYNKQIERGVDFLSVVQDILPPRQLNGEDAAMCAEYMRTLDIPLRLVPALAGALILHHITQRVGYDSNDTEVMESLRLLVERTAAWIAGARASSPPGLMDGATRA
jgi:hypothetical protein